jgi:hypothetical protein
MPILASFLGLSPDALFVLGVFAAWLLLQLVILPRLGVPT